MFFRVMGSFGVHVFGVHHNSKVIFSRQHFAHTTVSSKDHSASLQKCNSPSFCNHGSASGKFVVWFGGLCWIASWKRWLPMGYPSFEGPTPPGPKSATLTLTISWIAAVDLKHNQPNHTIPAVLARVTDFIHTLVGLDLSQDGPWDFTEKPLPKCSECMDYDIYITSTKAKHLEVILSFKKSFRWLDWKRELQIIQIEANLRSMQIIQIEE